MPSPIIIATFQATLLSVASNLCAQYIEAYQQERSFALDVTQLLRFMVYTIITAPPNYHWQLLLERKFPAYPPRPHEPQVDIEMKGEGVEHPKEGQSDPPSSKSKPKFSKRNTFTKWFVDCVTMGAIMNTVAFLILMGILKVQASSQILKNLHKETIPIIVAGYKIWMLPSVINFTFVPVHRRLVFLSFIGFLWGIYMSLVASKV